MFPEILTMGERGYARGEFMKKTLLVLFIGAMPLLFAEEAGLTVRLVRHGQPGVAGTDFTSADRAA